jgi:N-acetyl-beta-hexosaminidase
MEYEMDVVAMIDNDHNFVVTKTRCAVLDEKVFKKAGEDDVAKILKAWLTDGAPIVETVDPVDTLLATLKAVTTPVAFANATAEASALKPSMTRAQVQLVSDEVRIAKARVEQAAADAAEAEEAERALAAQEAAEKGDAPFASDTSATGSSASEGDVPLGDTASTSTEASAAGFAPTASSSAESAAGGAL